MKKIFITALFLISVLSMMLFASCKAPTYHELVFLQTDGVNYSCQIGDSEIYSGAKIQKGQVVSLKIEYDTSLVNNPIVYVNNTVVEPDANGIYKIVINSDTVIKVEGVTYNVSFDNGGGYVWYTSNGKDISQGVKLAKDEVLEFEVRVSVYYNQEFSVASNTEILIPNAETGKYTITADSDKNVSVIGLTQDEPYINRVDGGNGTERDPYLISKPIDLFYMAELINNDFYLGHAFYEKYYKLVNDIDLKGERFFVIGDNTSTTAFFAGSFDGNGKKISNFYIESIKLGEVETYLPYLGIFGYAAASMNRSPEVFNLTLENFEIRIDAGKHDQNFYAGGIAGLGIGLNVIGCNVLNAKIVADADDGYFGYAGGLVGVLQSAYSTQEIRYYSSIRSCYADVDLSADSGYVYALGGITGLLASYEERTNAFIVNSHTSGSIVGAIHCGGIAGRAEGNTSITSCYSTSEVVAQSTIYTSGVEEADVFSYAYAGGITGYLDYNSLVSESFFDGSVYASSVNIGDYQFYGPIVGMQNTQGTPDVHNNASYVRNSYSTLDNVTIDNNFIINNLKWDEADWVFNDNGYPQINFNETSKSFDVILDFGTQQVNGQNSKTVSITNTYIPFSYWNLILTNNELTIPEYVNADSGLRSYGYFFDEELTHKVPYSYVPTHNDRLYVGFADYSEVCGKYYIQTTNPKNNVYLLLDLDGKLTFVNGAFNLQSNYFYDGEEIVLIDTYIASLFNFNAEDDTEINNDAQNYYFSFKASVDNGILTAWDNRFFTANSKFVASKAIDGFNTGTYYDMLGREFVFYNDGQGFIYDTNSQLLDKFTYYLNDSTVKVVTSLSVYDAELNDDGYIVSINYSAAGELKMYDKFKGIWEKPFNFNESYQFDGKGAWKLTSPNGDLDGTYILTNNGNSIELSNGLIITYNEDATLTVNDLTSFNQTFYKQNSFVGTWSFPNRREPIELQLFGLNSEGIGNATLVYNTNNVIDNLKYEITSNFGSKTLTLFDNDFTYAILNYSNRLNAFEGQIYSIRDSITRNDALFCIADQFKGEWITSHGNFNTVKNTVIFNGNGLYDLDGTNAYMAIKGVVTIGGESTTYSINRETGEAIFIYNDRGYIATFDEQNNRINIYNPSNSFELFTYDKYRNIELVDTVGNIYSFDGMGLLDSKGKLSVTNGNSKVEYLYHIDNDIIIIYNMDALKIGEIVAKGSSFSIDINSTILAAYIKNSFTGSWLVSNQMATLVIGDFGSNNTATGTYLGTAVTFKLDNEKKVVSFEYNSTTYYVFALTRGELVLGTSVNEAENNTICVPIDNKDEYYGTYTNSIGESISFDGLGISNYSTGVVTVKNANGEIVKNYVYYIENNEPILQDNRDYIYKLVETTDVENGFLMNNKYYLIKQADVLFGVSASDIVSEKVFNFDGLGTVVSEDGTVSYSYEIIRMDTANYKVYLIFIDGQGNEYDVVLDHSYEDFKLTILEKSE